MLRFDVHVDVTTFTILVRIPCDKVPTMLMKIIVCVCVYVCVCVCVCVRERERERET